MCVQCVFYMYNKVKQGAITIYIQDYLAGPSSLHATILLFLTLPLVGTCRRISQIGNNQVIQGLLILIVSPPYNLQYLRLPNKKFSTLQPQGLYHSTRVLNCAILIPCKCYTNVGFGSCFVRAFAIFSRLSVCYTNSLFYSIMLSCINISLILIYFALLCGFHVLASSLAAALSIIKIGVFILLSKSFTSFLNQATQHAPSLLAQISAFIILCTILFCRFAVQLINPLCQTKIQP